MRCACGNTPLLQAPRYGILQRRIGVRAACYAHGLVGIGPASQNITDCPAQAGSRAAKRLDFGGMVVRFVLKFQQPFFRLAIHLNVRRYAACVDLFTFVQVMYLALIFQRFCTYGAQIHQGMRALSTACIAPGLLIDSQRLLKCRAHRPFRQHDFIQYRGKGGMPAVIRPIGI